MEFSKYKEDAMRNVEVKLEYDRLGSLRNVPVTPKTLYEWAVKNSCENKQLFITPDEIIDNIPLTMDGVYLDNDMLVVF